MGILKRIKHIASADINNFLDSFEDPVSMVKHYLREIEEQLDKSHAALANQLVVEKRYEALLAQTEELVEKRTRQANLALDRGEEAIALIALQEKIGHEEKLQVYREQQTAVKRQTAELGEELKKLTATYNDLQTRKQFLLSRVNAAAAVQNMTKVQNSFSTDSIARGFARMEEKVWRMEAGNEASRQVSRLIHPDGVNPVVSEAAKKQLEMLKAERNQA